MRNTLRSAAATAAMIALPMALTACSSTTEGDASAASVATSSATTSSAADPADDSSSAADSDSDSGDDSGGAAQSSDGSFTYAMPAGFEDATGQTTVPTAVVEIADLSTTEFPTTILVTTGASLGLSLDDATEAVRSGIESQFNVTTTEVPTGDADIDGEAARMFITTPYDQNGVSIASAVIVTIHNDIVYGFIMNATAANTESDISGLTDLVASVVWSD